MGVVYVELTAPGAVGPDRPVSLGEARGMDVDFALPDVPVLANIVFVLAHGFSAKIGLKPLPGY